MHLKQIEMEITKASHPQTYLTGVVCPQGLEPLRVTSDNESDNANGQLDLARVQQFMGSSQRDASAKLNGYKIKHFREQIHQHGAGCWHVRYAFKEYCQKIKQVPYGFLAHRSPFSREGYIGYLDCHARAVGFLQLMVLLGIEHRRLRLVMVGNEGDQTNKIAAHKPPDPPRIYHADDSQPDEPASNAIRLTLVGGDVTVSRCMQEPFANHYCAKVDIDGENYKYWDPLCGRAYINGFEDYFDSYTVDPSLEPKGKGGKGTGILCYKNPEKRWRRLYRLPQNFSAPIVRQTAYQACLADLRKHDSKDDRLYIVIDESDWGWSASQKGHQPVIRDHPPVIKSLVGAYSPP